MAVTPTLLSRAQLTTTAIPGDTIVTSGSGTTIVTNILLCNKHTTDVQVTMSFTDTGTIDRYILYNTVIAAGTTMSIDMSQVLSTTSSKYIKARASVTAVVDVHISGVVIT
jgi:hypothetical protein